MRRARPAGLSFVAHGLVRLILLQILLIAVVMDHAEERTHVLNTASGQPKKAPCHPTGARHS